MAKSDVLVIGSNMVDLITYIDRMPVEGETVAAPNFEMGCGGKGANQAVAAAKLGSKVSFVTMLGNDDFGKMQMQNYKSVGIDTSAIGVGNSNSGVAPIFVDPSSDNRIIIVKGANNELTPSVLDKYENTLKEAKIIVLQQEIPLETNYRAIELANKHDVPVLLNPAPANENLDIDYARRVDYFAPNETELSSLTKLPVENMDQIKLAAQKMVDLGVKNMIVTLGSKGVLWVNESHSELIGAMHVRATDTTGAGDSFIGSFAHYIAAGDAIDEAIRHANEYAGVTVTQKGTQKSYPSAEEFKSLKKKLFSIE
ncbi:ribokinase [Secundilactobacillus folii]|uniref:Deoxyribokinase n=1 Tax=Secundilactobacillus folii TaxID=2678357 RepID=A0A7X2XYU4_9LACO|nr:ribokinase [Secundilactobacillus folii]MTV82836.1 ribokinase [Secundilactobacillus folii]